MRIVGLLGVLVFLLVAQRQCSSAVATFVTGFGSGSADVTLPRPGTVDVPTGGPGAMPAGGSADPSAAAGSAGTPGGAGHELDGYERLRPGMTEAEIKAAIERARARAAGSSEPTSGSATPHVP